MLRFNEEIDTNICWNNTINYLKDKTCSLEIDTLQEYTDKEEYINDQIYNNMIYYEDIMQIYRALHFDGAVDIYEMKSTNEQVISGLYDFYNEIIEEIDE